MAGKIQVSVKKIILFSVFMAIFMGMFLFSAKWERNTTAATLFDNAVDWQPLQLISQEDGEMIYKLVFDRPQSVTFVCDGYTDIKLTAYNEDGSILRDSEWDNEGYICETEFFLIARTTADEPLIPKKAGTYYIRIKGKFNSLWYYISDPDETIDLSIDSTGTAFTNSDYWDAMELTNGDNGLVCKKIILSTANKIQFIQDSYLKFYVYNSKGQHINDKGNSVELQAGTYYIRYIGEAKKFVLYSQ
jgi:hypothetical protein